MDSDTIPSYGQALAEMNSVLHKVHEAEQLIDAAVFAVTKKRVSRLELYSRIHDRLPSTEVWQMLWGLTCRRNSGVPIQYLTGVQSFLDHEYCVGPGVLVPRPETEFLLMTAVEEMMQSGFSPTKGIEMGIGSGVLSIELISRWPNLVMLASEISEEARRFAFMNAKQILGPTQFSQLQVISVSDSRSVLEPFVPSLSTYSPEQCLVDFLITNPPYLMLGHDEIQEEVCLHEPSEALFAPVGEPLYFYHKIIEDSHLVLKNNGLVFAELPHERAGEILNLFLVPNKRSENWSVKLLPDLSKRSRVLVARFNR